MMIASLVGERLEKLVTHARTEMARRDAVEAGLRDDLDRAEGVKTILIGELLEEQRATRRASYLAAVLFCLLCYAEGWRILAWLWRSGRC